MLPLEIEIPSLQITLQDYITDEVAHQTRLDQLLLLDEKRVNVLEHMHTYQICIKQSFDKKVKIYKFNIGYLVLKENQQTSQMKRQLRDKFAPHWLGPYIIKRKFGSGVYHLAYLEGNEEHAPINIMHLHPFYS